MQASFEFFPMEYTFWSRFRRKVFTGVRVDIPDTSEINQMIEEFRKAIAANAEERVQKYRDIVKENSAANQTDLARLIKEEELDKFYSSKKGYHKYKNHIDETSWMTKDEFDEQDEYTARVYNTKEKVTRRTAFVLLVFGLVLGSIFLKDVIFPPEVRAFVIVDVESRGSLFIDENLAVGFKSGVIYPVNVGVHQLTVVASGFKTQPEYLIVNVDGGDTIHVSFDLQKIDGNMAFVKVNIPYDDAGIYVDGVFKGTPSQNAYLAVPAGDHTISLIKENYSTVPSKRTFSVDIGDTIQLNFKLAPIPSTSGAARTHSFTNVGMIEVNSNVRGAEIFIDGENNGLTTSYILQRIHFGQHILRVEKEGYKAYPKEHVIRLSKSERYTKVDFTLTSTSNKIKITVLPKSAKIYLDGKEVGIGRFNGAVDIGEHKITFSDLPNYINPGERTIKVEPKGENNFNFRFGSDLHFEVTPDNMSENVKIRMGYLSKSAIFKGSRDRGPEVVPGNGIQEKMWELGYAFEHRDPPGSNGVLIDFTIPNFLNVTKDIKLKLWIYDSGYEYPLVLSGDAEFRVVLNGTTIADNLVPKYNSYITTKNKFEEFFISGNLRVGNNTLIITSGENNTKFIHLWKVVIE